MEELDLTRPGAGEPESTLRWDPQAGTVEGPAADTVRALASAALEAGGVESQPWHAFFEITHDPLADRRAMALILGQRWRVPEALADAYPQPPDDPSAELDERLRPFIVS